MFKNIFKISLGLCLLALITQAEHKTQITLHVLKEFSNQLDISPYERVGNKLYYFGQSKVTWFKALLICRSMGGFLASFESPDELNELSKYMTTKFPTEYWWWLSGSDLDVEGDFYWYRTGERMGYSAWTTGQPDNHSGQEDCAVLWYQSTRYEMNDFRCDLQAYYVCEADKPKTIVVSIF